MNAIILIDRILPLQQLAVVDKGELKLCTHVLKPLIKVAMPLRPTMGAHDITS